MDVFLTHPSRLRCFQLSFVFCFFTRTVAISCFPRAQLSVMDLQVTAELSFILTGLRCQPFGFSLASSISLVDAKFTRFFK